MPEIAVLGSGMAGFGAVNHLHSEGVRPTVYDSKPHHGGHTASHSFSEGFVLDEGPHISFTKNERVMELFANSVEQEYDQFSAKVNNYWRGHWIDHPAQCHLHGLPTDLVAKVIEDFAKSAHSEPASVNNYEEWLREGFGDTFSETFPMTYTRKYHTTDAINLSTDWVGPRVYRPKMDEVLRGALEPAGVNYHYITQFRYPKRGGYVSYLNGFLDKADLNLGHKLVGLDPNKKELRFENGHTAGYDEVVSSIPLPALIPMIDGAPDDVRSAAAKLACSEAVVVSVGIDDPNPHDAHWSYFYDEDISFARLSTPHLQSRNNVPEGCSCLMAECYFSDKYKPLKQTPESLIPTVINDLKKSGIIKDHHNVVFSTAMHLKYANVIFDHERREALQTVHGYLDDINVRYCGRYGLWAYIWTDQSFLSGEKAAEKALSGLPSPA